MKSWTLLKCWWAVRNLRGWRDRITRETSARQAPSRERPAVERAPTPPTGRSPASEGRVRVEAGSPSRRAAVAGLGALVVWACSWCGWAAGPALHADRTDPLGWVQIRSTGRTGQVHSLEASADLVRWREVAVLHDGPFAFADPESAGLAARFYRLVSRSRGTADDGKNQVQYAEDAFLALPAVPDGPRWVKFAILLSDANRVWLQDSQRYPFHYDYARARLAPFQAMTRAEFDAVTLRRTNQLAVLGAVLVPPEGQPREVGIQFVGLDPYPREQVVAWFHRVRSAVYADPPVTAYYMPVPEQAEVAEANAAYFEGEGVRVSRVERWLAGDACYAPGWALGRLVYVPADEILAAYADGRLLPSDILLTDGVPAEVPFVAGIISLVPATPNSHVAILAQSYGVPFVYLSAAEERDRAKALAGRDVILRLTPGWNSCSARLIEVAADLSPELRAELLGLKAPAELQITPKERYGAISVETVGLVPADIRYVGGKAANFGLLRRVIPEHSPDAVAFTFDLWDGFMDQPLAGYAWSLREEIGRRLAGFHYPPDVGRARAVLAGIRELIRNQSRFTPAQEEAIHAALARFDPGRKVRFRSSTNVEDSEQFTGAGLYDSYSGCRADDLDGDTVGPSACDPGEPNERGVFRAIRRVFASFYNDNAWLERSRFGLDETEVGMAVLAHLSYPDEDELANGVSTIRFEQAGVFKNYTGELVTQAGAVSVANPAGGALPEVIAVSKYSTEVYLDVKSFSNLVPMGAHVMSWPGDYQQLAQLLVRVTDGYQALTGVTSGFVLDFEYKKARPGRLEVKQVRRIPQRSDGSGGTTYLLNEPVTWVVHQGEGNDNVWSVHRLKCRLESETLNLRMVAGHLDGPVHTNATIEIIEGTRRVRRGGGASGWPEASCEWAGDVVKEHWRVVSEGQDRRFTLETSLRTQPDTAGPIYTQQDLFTSLRARYAIPVLVAEPDGRTRTVTEEFVRLVAEPKVTVGSLLQNRSVTAGQGVRVETSFYWPEPPKGPTAGYTAPLVAWVGTRITGLTSAPLVLRSEYAQTYRPGHHNFYEEFVFEPRLDPEANAAALRELADRDVLALYLAAPQWENGVLYALGANGKLRRL